MEYQSHNQQITDKDDDFISNLFKLVDNSQEWSIVDDVDHHGSATSSQNNDLKLREFIHKSHHKVVCQSSQHEEE